MRDYATLDQAIIDHIRSRPTFAAANNAEVCEIARSIDPFPIAWRVVDRRTQALRKAGRIRYAGKKHGWEVLE